MWYTKNFLLLISSYITSEKLWIELKIVMAYEHYKLDGISR